MTTDIEKLFSLLDEDVFTDLFKKYDIDFEELIGNYETIPPAICEKVYNENFAFLDKYIDDPAFFEALDIEENIGVLMYLKFVAPGELYYKILDIYYRDKDLSTIQGMICDTQDLEYFKEKNIDFKDIVTNFELFPDIQLLIVRERPDLFDFIIENIGSPSAALIAEAVVKNNFKCLDRYFRTYREFGDVLNDLLVELLKYDDFDFNLFFDELITKYLGNNDISILEDESLISKLIDACGSKALIFAKNPTLDMIQKSNFSYYEYSLYEGSYKKSTPLLMKFLNEGKADALMYAKSEAINEDVVAYIKNNNIPLERLKSFDNIKDSFPLAKYFVENGDFSLLYDLSSLTTDLDCFEFAYNLFLEGKFSFTSGYYGSNQFNLLCGVFNHNWSDFYSYRNFDIELPIALRLIEIGLTVSDFFEHLVNVNNKDVFIEAFAIKGFYLPLLYSHNESLVEKYIDNITYELFLQASNFSAPSLSRVVLYKLVREGHFEPLQDGNLYLHDSDLKKMGFDNISYEEYLKLPDYVQNISVLKQKFLEYDETYLKEVLETNPTSSLLEKAALSGMSFDELLPYINNYVSLNEVTVLYYLKQGEIRAVNYFGYSRDSEMIESIVELYYSLLNGELPNKEVINNSMLTSGLLKKYLIDHRYEVLTLIDRFDDNCVDILFECGFDFSLFIKYPILNEGVISRFISLDNEEELINIFSDLHSKDRYIYISNSAKLFLEMYRAGFSKDSLKKFTSFFNVDGTKILQLITENEYDIFDCIDLTTMLKNKLFLSKILSFLDVEKVRKLISDSFYSSSDSKVFVIRKMVERGYYDFISYYSDKIEEDVLKRALFGGYFPEDQILNNKYFKMFVEKINFTEEELNYLRSKIDSDVRYIIFFTDIINDNVLLSSYLKKDNSIIRFLDIQKRNDVSLLTLIVNENPKLCSQVIHYGISSDTLCILIKENHDLLNYLDSRYLSLDVIKEIVDSYPNVIDFYSGYCNDSIFLSAIEHGYVFSEKTSYDIIRIALRNNFNVDENIVKRLGLKNILKLSHNLITEIDSPLYKYFKKIIDDFAKADYYNFIFEFVSFRRTTWIYSDVVNQFLDSFGVDLFKYSTYNFDDKETFILSIKLNELPKDDSAADCIDEIVNNTSNIHYLIEWLGNHFSEFELVKKKYNEIAKKYFLDEPLFYANYVDPNDVEVLKMAKEVVLEYPDLYKILPSILDNKDLILALIEKTDGNVFFYLSDEFRVDLDILEAALKLNENIFSFVDTNNPKIRQFAKENMFNYPIVCVYIPNLITNKEDALKLINYNNGYLYSYFAEELKNDYDICLALLDVDPQKIYYISNTVSNFKKLVIKALEKDGSLFYSLKDRIVVDEEILTIAVKTYPDALFMVSDEFFIDDLFKHISDITKISSNLLTLPKILQIIHFDSFDFENQQTCEFIADSILNRIDYSTTLDKSDSCLRKIFAKAFGSSNKNIVNSDGVLFRKIVSVLPFLDISIFSSDLQVILKDTMVILSSTGKLNTLEKNPVFNYDVVKYIYPLFGLDFVKDIIKYNTPAASVVINEIKNNNNSMIVDYYKIICNYNVFSNDDKRVHYAFRDFLQIKSLITDILSRNISLTEEDVINLRKIIVGKNIYDIKSYDELQNYNEKTQNFWKEKLNTDDIMAIKNVLATLFGYSNVSMLSNDFNNFQLNNFINLKVLRDDLIKQYGPERAEEIFKECFYTKKDVSIITLMDRVINSENINELKELMSKLIKEKNGALDYCDEVRKVIRKTRLLHNYQFNGRLTKIEDIKSKRIEKDDPNNKYGVTIIEMDSEKFNFLAHRIYSYDGNMSGFKEMLMRDPSLWTKLEGASTLSTSSISDKGFWFINNMDNSGVVYLFNDLPKEFMLFMYGRDLYVEHGGYKIEPTANSNSFTNVDALNQTSCYRHCFYNEVAGFRDGMLPCAFACVGDVPNEATIRAAKYFSDYLGVDIPIIKFNIPAYDAKKVEDYKKAKEDFKNFPNYQAMYNIFFDGIKVSQPEKSIQEKVDYCLSILNNKYQNKDISYDELSRMLYEMETLVSQIIVGLPDSKKELSKIGIFRKTLAILKRQSLEEVIKLESAQLGESGIMYRYTEGDGTYLIKPSVDKKGFSNQAFRADIQEAASRLQEFLSPATSVKVESIGGKMKISKQELIDISSENSSVLEDWVKNGGTLDYQYSSSLLREYVVDFLLCNFDCYVGNFIIDSSNNVRGIDKEQSFRFISDPNSLKADFSFIPNGNHRVPIYKILFDRYKAGEIDLDLSVVTDTIEKVKLLTDEEYKNIFKDYAVGLDKYRIEEILNLILQRRDDAILNMEEFIESLKEMKNTEGVTL